MYRISAGGQGVAWGWRGTVWNTFKGGGTEKIGGETKIFKRDVGGLEPHYELWACNVYIFLLVKYTTVTWLTQNNCNQLLFSWDNFGPNLKIWSQIWRFEAYLQIRRYGLAFFIICRLVCKIQTRQVVNLKFCRSLSFTSNFCIGKFGAHLQRIVSEKNVQPIRSFKKFLIRKGDKCQRPLVTKF